MANFGFNPEEYKDPVNNFNPVPKGRYYLKCEEAELMDTREGNGQYIKGKFTISRGEHENRKIFVNFNIINKNDTAQRISREQLSAWARACGKPGASDTDQLIEIEFQAEVGIEKGKGQYEGNDQNRVLEWLTADGSKTTAGGGKPAAQAGTAAQATGGQPINDPARQGPAKAANKPAPAAGKKTTNPWDDA